MNKLPETEQVESYHILGSDGKPLCSHEDTTIVKACCTPLDRGSHGYIECACGGVDSIECENPFCTGLTDEDVEKVMNECWD